MAGTPRIEHRVFHGLDLLSYLIDDGEIAVDERVEQRVHRDSGTVPDLIGVLMPPFHCLRNLRDITGVDRYEIPFADEYVYFVATIAPETIEDEKEIIWVLFDFGSLPSLEDIFQRKLVEVELTAQELNVTIGGILNVQPENTAPISKHFINTVEIGRFIESALGLVHEGMAYRH